MIEVQDEIQCNVSVNAPLLISQIVMKSGSGRVWVTIFGFLLGNYHRVSLGFSGFATMNVLNVGFRVGFRSHIAGSVI